MKRHSSKLVFTILLVVLVLLSTPLPQVHANLQTASQAALTADDTVPVTYVNATPPIHQYTITLITGDILYVSKSDGGAWSVAVREAPRQYGTVPFETFSDSQKGTYAVPADVVSLVPNLLDPYLFNVEYITENHLNDESTSVLGAVVQYAPGSPLSNQWDNNSVQYSNLTMVNSQAISIPKENAADFGRHIINRPLSLPNGIQKIWLDKVATAALDQSVPMIGGDVARNVLGYNGTGINIAILDTGIDATHPDFFFANGTSKVIVRIDATCLAQPILYCDHTTKDLFGHGTHVASIAAGTGAASGGRYTGVAPGASLMSIKVLNEQGFGFDSWVMIGLQLAAQGINGVKADVISMSLGAGPTDGSDPLSQAINQIVSAYGIPVVIAAGNSGCDFCVASPGAADDAITVAATTKAVSPGLPSIATFSSRGPRVDNLDVKPDIAAPGVGVVAACSSTAGPIPCPRGSRYTTLSGTSMATPHVSGSVALLLQQARQRGITLTPAEIKDVLQSSSIVLPPSRPGQPDVDIYQQGAGLIRIDHALEASVIFNSSEISFGNVPFTTPSLQRTFQVMNLGTTTMSVSLSYQMRDVPTTLSIFDTGATFNGLVSLDQNKVTIAAGSSASVTLTINVANLPTRKLWSVFSGRIFASSGNTTLAHAIFGFAKEGPRQTALLTGINPAGSYLVVGQEFSVYDALDPLGFENFFVNVDSNGHAALRLPPSSYNFIMDTIIAQLHYTDGFFYYYYYSYYRIVALEVPVTSSPANVTLDASKAQPVSLNLQADPSANNGLQQDDIADYIRPDGSYVQDATFVFAQTWNIYAVNNATAKLGTFWTFDRWLVTRSPAETSPVLYDISMTNHTQQPITHTVNDLSAFAKTYAAYHGESPQAKAFGRWSFPTAFNETITFTFFYRIVPSQRIEYQQPTEAGYRQFFAPSNIVGNYPVDFFESPFWFDSPFPVDYSFAYPLFGSSQLGRVDAPGETHNETWAAQPVHPRLTLAQRQGDNLLLSGFEVTDNYGHVGNDIADYGVNFQMSVYVDGKLSTVRNFIWYGYDANLNLFPLPPVNVSLPRTAAIVEVIMQLQSNRYWTGLATNGTSDIVFRTSHGLQGPIQLPTYNYDVMGLNLLNQAQLDNSETLQVRVALLAPNGARIRPVDASAEIAQTGASTWTSASVLNLGKDGMLVSAHIPATGRGYFFWISLRISVMTAEGIAYTETITSAVEAVS